MVRWLRLFMSLIGVTTLFFGVWSALAPRRSIELYQRIMARLNWRVSPINASREIQTTRFFGGVLVALSLAMCWCLR